MTGAARRSGGRGASGFAALELVAGTALLLLPVVCAALAHPAWAERRTTAELAARDAVRRVALATVCDVDAARESARDAARSGGVAERDLVVALDCAPGAVLARDATVTARVRVAVPALAVPGLGAVGAWHVTVARTLVVDPYSSVPEPMSVPAPGGTAP